mgnify:CR=1 FL=1
MQWIEWEHSITDGKWCVSDHWLTLNIVGKALWSETMASDWSDRENATVKGVNALRITAQNSGDQVWWLWTALNSSEHQWSIGCALHSIEVRSDVH